MLYFFFDIAIAHRVLDGIAENVVTEFCGNGFTTQRRCGYGGTNALWAPFLANPFSIPSALVLQYVRYTADGRGSMPQFLDISRFFSTVDYDTHPPC